MEIPKDLSNDIWDFCRNNNITNIDDFTLKLLKQGFTSEKFGSTPMITTKEKIVEKIVEVPVEKIVEKIVEVPVTMVDDEVSENLKKYIKLYEETQSKLNNALNEIADIKKQLDLEKARNKKDLYGE
jgi:hypothetical protein